MKRFLLAAAVAVALSLGASTASAQHCPPKGPYGFVPGHINLTGSIGLSWGAIGFGQLNHYNPSYGAYGPGYGFPGGQGFVPPQGYGGGYGGGYGDPSFGGGYPGFYGY